MKKFVIVFLSLIFLSSLAWAQTATPPSGSGTSVSPYQITSWQNLYWISQNSTSWDKYFEQTSDITFPTSGDDDIQNWDNGAGWQPIGNSTTKFTGSYDASYIEEVEGESVTKSYSISDLFIYRPLENNVGLFGHVGVGATIKNIGLLNVDIKGARGTGSLVGRVTGDVNTYIEYCSANGGTVVGDGATGGLVGTNNSYSTSPSYRNEHPTIQYSWANIDVSWSQKSASGADKFGGLAGCNQKGNIFYSYSRGSVTVENTSEGISVTNDDETPGVPSRIGGLIGCILIRGLVENSYSTAQVTTNYDVANVGGLVGRGGTGGSGGNAYDCFYESTGNPNFQSGSETAYTLSGVTGESTTNMKNEDTYTGWDFTNIWSIDEGNGYPTLKANPQENISITFNDGSGYTAPAIIQGNSDQPIGRFDLNAGGSGSILERVTVQLRGDTGYSGTSNYKLWTSSDASFGSDTQLSASVQTIRFGSAGVDTTEVSFSISNEISTSQEYYFVTCDVASDASGTIDTYIQDISGFSVFKGSINSTFLNAKLSDNGSTLPVTLSSFTAFYSENGLKLQWVTQSEDDNAGWNIYRGETETAFEDQTSLQLNSAMGLIPGAGTTSQPTEYEFEDIMPILQDRTYYYWLESVDYSGSTELYGPVMVEIPDNEEGFLETPDMPHKYGLQNYPNPFNPSTEISFVLPKASPVELNIYNLKGRRIRTLISGETLGKDKLHTVVWDGKDSSGQAASSGIYLYKLITQDKIYSKKMLLVK